MFFSGQSLTYCRLQVQFYLRKSTFGDRHKTKSSTQGFSERDSERRECSILIHAWLDSGVGPILGFQYILLQARHHTYLCVSVILRPSLYWNGGDNTIAASKQD
jgi:hypothetical protein